MLVFPWTLYKMEYRLCAESTTLWKNAQLLPGPLLSTHIYVEESRIVCPQDDECCFLNFFLSSEVWKLLFSSMPHRGITFLWSSASSLALHEPRILWYSNPYVYTLFHMIRKTSTEDWKLLGANGVPWWKATRWWAPTRFWDPSCLRVREWEWRCVVLSELSLRSWSRC